MTLTGIDAVIADTDYNRALLLLNQYVVLYPDQFDDVQERIKKIMNARQSYMNLAQKLIDVIQNEPENNEKKLDIITQLQTLEKHPSEEHLAFIRQAKVAAQFTYYRALFNKIMKDGGSLVAANKYSDAVVRFQQGFSLYQDDFYEQYTDGAVTGPVKSALSAINENASSFNSIQISLNGACTALINAVQAGNYPESQAAFAVVKREFSRFAQIRNAVASAGFELDDLFQKLKEKQPDLTDSSFLPFASRFTLGKTGDPDTGILGAMDAEWNVLVERIKPVLYQQIVKQEGVFADSTGGSNVFSTAKPSRQALVLMRDFADMACSVNALYDMRYNSSSRSTKIGSQYDASMQYVIRLVQAVLSQLENIDGYKKEKDETAILERPMNPALSLRSKDNGYTDRKLAAAGVYSMISNDSAGELKADWYTNGGMIPAVATEAAAGITIKDPVLEWKNLRSVYDFLCTASAARADTEAAKEWVETASFFADAAEKIADEYTAGIGLALHLFAGIGSSDTILFHGNQLPAGVYPAESLETVQSIQKTLPGDRNLLVKSQETLAAGGNIQPLYVVSSKKIADSIAVLDSVYLKSSQLADSAGERILLAQRAKNEADLRYSHALEALHKEDFNTARDYLQRARTKYNESLSYQESLSLRSLSDKQLGSLGGEIAKAENQIVVYEVRHLKNQAKTEYYNGNFEQASNLLVRAKTRWELTNVEEDLEITNMMALVSTAMSMKTGRIIPPTAPLYPEMSQILNIAHQYFDTGKKLMTQGARMDAVDILNKAREKLRELQQVYPLNQEASLLTLRIDQLVNPDEFSRSFTQKVQSARQNYKDLSQRQVAYTSLLDLYEINPEYPGLKQLIYNIEIEIGVRQKPADKTEIHHSDILTGEAQRIVEEAGRDEIKLRLALSKVDEAIKLNPDNDDAMLLKDRIQMTIGGTAAVVLTSEDEQKYQQAIQELQKNNIIGANAIVEQLLQNPVNRRSAKVLDIQKKVKALL